MSILRIAVKDLRILLRNRGELFMLFLLPLVFVLAFSLPMLAAGAQEEALTSLPVANRDPAGGQSLDLIVRLNATGGIEVVPYDPTEAERLLNEGEIDHLLTIPDDFSQLAMDHPVSLRLANHPDADETESQWLQEVITGVIREMAMELHLLESLEQMGQMVQAAPSEYHVFTAERLVAQAQSQFREAEIRPLITVEQVEPAMEEAADRPQLIGTQVNVAGMAVLFAFLSAQTTARSIYDEKRLGSFRRLLAAPMSRATLLAGKVLPNLITALLQIVVIFAFGILVLPLLGAEGLVLGNDPLAVVLVSIVVALCSTGLGVLIAAIARTESQMGGIAALVLWVMAALGGSFIPTFLFRGPIDTISRIVPHSWALRAYYDLLVRGHTLEGVALEVAVLLGFAVLFFLIGLWRFDFD